MIETVITIKFKTTQEVFESDDFQEELNAIKSGEYAKSIKREYDGLKSCTATYWTDYKIKKK